MTFSTPYDQLVAQETERGLLESVFELVEWDESVFMPPGGAVTRGEQKALLARLIHERATDPKAGELLEALEATLAKTDPMSPEAANVRGIRRSYDRLRRLPKTLVEEIARESTVCVEVWTEARRDSNFKHFAPRLKRMLDLKREEAKALGSGKDLYDSLLDVYEPGCKSADIEAIFAEVKPQIVAFLERVRGSSEIPKRKILHREYPLDGQRSLGERVVELMGFDMRRGRLDVTTHPFCRSVDSTDVRLTTRYSLNDFSDAFFSTVHEAGHGLYEQGLGPNTARLPMGKAASFGLHESQSRMWENLVARSASFWEYFYPLTQRVFPAVLSDVTATDFTFAINAVEASFIRVNADEVTYNLHIILRYELERALICGDLCVEDLPAAWNAKFKETLGLVPPDDASGCLQDIHWAAGLFGYFPTYTLGNLYAAQLMETARAVMPDMDLQFRKGNLLGLRDWLNEKIHCHGQRFLPNELCERVTGRSLSCAPLMKHFDSKISLFYNA